MRTYLIFVLVLTVFLGGCSVESVDTSEKLCNLISGCSVKDASSNDSVNNSNAIDLYSLLEEKGIVVLDVRTEKEFVLGHVDGSVNIDFYNPNFRNLLGSLEKDKTYYVYCRSGKRSEQAVKIMKELGFEDVHNVKGGINSWHEKGLPLVK